MKRFAIVLASIALLVGSAVFADALTSYFSSGGGVGFRVSNVDVSTTNPIPVAVTSNSTSVAQANISSINGSVPNVSTTVTLSAPSQTIDVYTSTDASILHINWANGTATTSNAALYPGGTYRYAGTAISAFKIIGEGTNGTYNVVAK